jgi:ribonucleoside-diphosphate reductase alpha chain
MIQKRDKTYEEFDYRKIKRSILTAFEAAGEVQISEVDDITQKVMSCVGEKPTVEEVQTCIEEQLIDYGYHRVAQSYMNYRIRRDVQRQIRMEPDPAALSTYIHRSKYARGDETWEQTVERMCSSYEVDFDPEIKKAIIDGKLLPSMRSLQFGGNALSCNHARMYNCCFTQVNRVKAFSDILFLLLSGCGVGYSVQWPHISCLPAVHEVSDVEHYVIPDDIEGWSNALHILMCSYLEESSLYYGKDVEFAFNRIRDKGSPLVTSGGQAPGHKGLKAMLERVRMILQSAVHRQLRPIEVHDIICHVAECVVSGGIRRSSLISLFSLNDTEMMYSKDSAVFSPDGLNSQRCMANNSVVITPEDNLNVIKRIMKLSQGYGEPGYVYLPSHEWGVNPCGEILFDHTETPHAVSFCNLVEINGKHLSERTAYLAGKLATYQRLFNRWPYRIEGRNDLIGVSITGIMDNTSVCLDADVLQRCRTYVNTGQIDAMNDLGITLNMAERYTCVKPSGTASLLLGCSPGIHSHHARRYFRRVRFGPTDAVGMAFMRANPHMIETINDNLYCAVFPIKAPDNAIIDPRASQQLRNIKLLYENWATHNISATVTVQPDEMDSVIDQIINDIDVFRCLSFVPPCLDTKYPHAPLEAVVNDTQETYWNTLIKGYTPVDYKGAYDSNYGSACEGSKCTI